MKTKIGLEWLGEAWRTGRTQARLSCHCWLPESMAPRVSWGLDIRHYVAREPGDTRELDLDRWASIEIGHVLVPRRDWRELAGLEIRADAAWHEANEYVNEYGRLSTAELHVRTTYLAGTPGNPGDEVISDEWRGCDWHLRLGARDGTRFPCELDGWLLPDAEFERTTPETPKELRRFGEGPPDLRVLTNLVFERCTVKVPRTADPAALARRYLRELIGLEETYAPQVERDPRRTIDGNSECPLDGPSTVTLHAGPGPLKLPWED